MASVKSGNPNAWNKTRDTVEDTTFANGGETVNTVSSGVHYAEKKALEAATLMKDVTVDLAGKGIDATKSGSANAWGYTKDITDQGIDATKLGTATAFDYTKDMTGKGIDATKIGTGTAWDHTNDIIDQGFVVEDHAVDKMSSGKDFAGRKIKDAAVSVKNATVDLNGEDNDATSAWDHTKEIAGNVTDSIYNTGSDICDAVKSGVEAGWNKIAGDEK